MTRQNNSTSPDVKELVNDGEIFYTILRNKSIKVFNIPAHDKLIDVIMRGVSIRDADILQDSSLTISQRTYKLLAAIITQWGDRDSITMLELSQPNLDEAVLILDQIAQQFCVRKYNFSPRPE